METIPLGASGRSTTRLGFGCSSIMGSLGRRDSLKMLEAAWDAGIRHFDVAPMYGYGEAEDCLGAFLSRHRGQATIASKFGILPRKSSSSARLARSVVRPVVQKFPKIKQYLAKSSAEVTRSSAPVKTALSDTSRPPNPLFSTAAARKSLHRSLESLQCERIDLWLLHDVTAADLVDEELLRFLEDAVQEGLVGTFGAGTDRSQIEGLLRLRPGYCRAIQYEWSVFNPVPSDSEAFRVHHRSLTASFRTLHTAMVADKERCSRWSDSVGADLSKPEMVANLMLKAALVLNPESVILFSSKNPKHIEANVRLVTDGSLANAAKALYEIVQHEFLRTDLPAQI